MKWIKLAKCVRDEYGCQVDMDERFFVCPECDEPIYERDWANDEDLEAGICPVCGFNIINPDNEE